MKAKKGRFYVYLLAYTADFEPLRLELQCKQVL